MCLFYWLKTKTRLLWSMTFTNPPEIGQSRKHHNNFCLSPQIWQKHCFCFSWDHCTSLEKLETMLVQNLGGHKRVRTSTGFEPVISQHRCFALTNWAIKPLTLEAGHWWDLMSPWRMDVRWYMKCFIYWTADLKSSKLWSSQLWTQFKQLHKEAS